MLYEPNIKSIGEDAAREKLRQYYDYEPPEHVACVGCHNEGTHTAGDCEIRKCCISHSYPTCAACSKMPCEWLKNNWTVMQGLKNAHPDIPSQDYAQWYGPYDNEPVLLKIKERGEKR
jgi:hypothetical protein